MEKTAKLIKCATYSDCTAALKEAVGVSRGIDGAVYVFCEDKLTLTAEKAVSESTGGTFDKTVTTFKRFLYLHGGNEKTLSKSGSSVVIRRIIVNHAAELKTLGKRGLKSLPSAIYELISQLKSSGVGFKDLYEAAKNSDGLLSDKLHDVALIYDLYERETIGNFKDSGSYLDELPTVIKNDPTLAHSSLYLVGYAAWTAQAEKAVKALVESAKEVTVISVSGLNKGVYLNETANKFKKICSALKCKLVESEFNSELPVSAKKIAENLFNPSVFSNDFERGYKNSNVFIYAAENAYDEALYVAKIIRESIINKGLRYRDFAVALSGLDKYSQTVCGVFADFGIPTFADDKRKLTESAVYRYVKSYYECVRKGNDRDDVKDFIASPLFPYDDDIKDNFLLYVSSHGVNRGGFLKPFKDDTAEMIRKAYAQIIEPLKKRGTAADFVKATKFLFENLETENMVKTTADRLVELGKNDESAFLIQSFDKLLSVMQEIADLSLDAPLNLIEYMQIIAVAAEAAEISMIPQSDDSVYITELTDARLRRVHTLFVVGLTNGVPAGKQDSAILNDSDLTRLENLSLLVEPKISLVNDRSRETFSLALLSFTDRLILTYPVSGERGEQTVKSEALGYVSAIFENAEKGIYISTSFKDLKAKINAAEGERGKYLKSLDYLSTRPALKKFADGCSEFKDGFISDFSAENAYFAAAKDLIGQENNKSDDELKRQLETVITTAEKKPSEYLMSGSVIGDNIAASRLECYFSCPYKHFAKYVLGLADSDTGEVKPLEAGNILHEAAKNYVNSLSQVIDKETSDKLVEKIISELYLKEEYSRFGENAKTMYTLTAVKEEAKRFLYGVYQQFAASDFVSFGCEVAFGFEKDKNQVLLNGASGAVSLNGKIDRIDVADNFVRVVDYKSGDYDTSFQTFYTGNKLQLYLYLSALKNSGKTVAGAYYCPISNDLKKVDDDNIALDGQTLGDMTAVLKADKNLANGGKSELIGVTLNNGSIKATKNVLNEREMNAFVSYARAVSEVGIGELQQGFIAPSPYKESCKYCSYGALCGFEDSVNGFTRQVDTVTKEVITTAAEEYDELKNETNAEKSGEEKVKSISFLDALKNENGLEKGAEK